MAAFSCVPCSLGGGEALSMVEAMGTVKVVDADFLSLRRFTMMRSLSSWRAAALLTASLSGGVIGGVSNCRSLTSFL